MLRVAVAGAGMVSQYHLRAWSVSAHARVIALCDPDLQRATDRAAEFAVGAVYDDAAQMLDVERPDALDIAAGHAAHGTLVELAAQRGVAVLCQKPLAPTFAEARNIAEITEGRTRLMVHENWRFRPWYQLARDWLNEGTIGEPMQLRLEARSSGLLLHDGLRPALARQPMLALLPRMMIGEVLVHHLDVACLLLGRLAVRSALIRHEVPQMRGESAAVIELAGIGTQATVAGNFTVAGTSPSVTDHLHIQGTAGAIVLDGTLLSATGNAPRAATFDLAAGYQQSYDAAIAHFAEALLHDRPFATSPAVHLRVLGLVEDAYRLAGEGRVPQRAHTGN